MVSAVHVRPGGDAMVSEAIRRRRSRTPGCAPRRWRDAFSRVLEPCPAARRRRQRGLRAWRRQVVFVDQEQRGGRGGGHRPARRGHPFRAPGSRSTVYSRWPQDSSPGGHRRRPRPSRGGARRAAHLAGVALMLFGLAWSSSAGRGRHAQAIQLYRRNAIDRRPPRRSRAHVNGGIRAVGQKAAEAGGAETSIALPLGLVLVCFATACAAAPPPPTKPTGASAEPRALFLSEVISMHGWPCDAVTDFQEAAPHWTSVTCRDGNTYEGTSAR